MNRKFRYGFMSLCFTCFGAALWLHSDAKQKPASVILPDNMTPSMREVWKMEQLMDKADLSGDSATLSRHTADDALTITGYGVRLTKEGYLKKRQADAKEFAKIGAVNLPTKIEDVLFREYGNTVIYFARSTFTWKDKHGALHPATYLNCDVWVKTDGQWINVSGTATAAGSK